MSDSLPTLPPDVEARLLLSAIVEGSQDAIISKTLDGIVMSWNTGAEQLYGYTAAEMVGRPISVLIPPSQPDELPALLDRLRRGERIEHYETVRVRKDGRRVDVSERISPIADAAGRIVGASSIARGITSQKQAERRRSARLAVTQILAEAEAVEAAAPAILRAVCEGLQWDVGVLWVADAVAGVVRCLDVWHQPSARIPQFVEACRTLTFPRNRSLPGRVWNSGQPEWIPNVAEDDNFVRAEVAAREGLHGALACPIRLGDHTLGVIEFFSRQIREPDADLLEMMLTLGGQIGQFMERKRAEEQQRRSESELADFFHNATVGLHWVGPDGTILRVNQAELDLLGYTEEEYVGRHIAEFHADQNVIADILRRLAAGEKLQDYPARMKCKDGSLKDVLIDSSVRWDDGRFVHTRCFTRDVTDRKRAEEAARQRQRQLELIANNAPVLIAHCDLEHRYTFVNRPYAARFGLEPQDLIGRRVPNVLGEEAYAVIAPYMDAALLGQRVEFEAEVPYRDLPAQHMLCAYEPERDADGRPVGYVAAITNVTEHKRIERALREEARISDTLHRISRSLAAELDVERIIQTVTDESTALTGAQFGAFFYNVRGERGESYMLYTLAGAPREAFAGFPMPRNTEIFEPTFRGQGIVRLDDVTQDPRFGKNPPYHGMPPEHLPVRSYLAAPVVSRSGEVLGGLFFGHAEAGFFAERHERLLEGIAAQAAVAIDNAGLYGQVKESEQRFRELAEHIEDVFYVSDARQPRMLYISPAYERIWGRTCQSLYDDPRSFLESIHPDDRPRVLAALERQVHGDTTTEEYRIVQPGGAVHWIWDRAFPVRDAGGEVIRVVGVAEDISAQKQAERALRDSEQRFARFMQHLPGLAWIKDAAGRYVYANEAAINAFGVPPEKVIGRTDDEVFPPDTAAQFQEHDRRALSQAADVQVIETLRHSDGTLHHSLVNKFTIPAADGKEALVGGMAIDITERKRFEEDLQFLADASATLATIVDYESTLQKVASLAVPHFADWCAVDLVEADGTLRRLAVTHVDPAKVALAHELQQRYSPHSDSPHGAYHVLRTGQPEMMTDIPDALIVNAARDEEHLRIIRELGLKSFVCVPLVARGKTIGVITFVTAESGRRYTASDQALAEELARRAAIALENTQLYRELKEADRRKDEFLATLAHELRNPLAPIRNSLQILKMPRLDDETAHRTREMMERQVHHLVRLVDDLLDVSRVMRGKIELRTERVELASVVARAVETAQPLIDAQGHELTVALPPESMVVEADPVRLAQVVGNLLTNAAKYTEAGGRIELSAEHDAGRAVLRVRDSGIGIPPEMLPHIFELFVQVDSTATRSQGGLGIGLTLVKNLVEMHHGSVKAFSAGPGQGSEFVVDLPLAAPQPESASDGPQVAQPHEPAPRGHRLLVVDDNADAAASLAMLLRLQGHDVRIAHDGPSALEMLNGYVPDLVFLDIGMPGMDGYEVARRLRQRVPLPKLRLVALTGWGQQEDRRRSAEAGFDHHLVKPVEPRVIDELLQRLWP